MGAVSCGARVCIFCKSLQSAPPDAAKAKSANRRSAHAASAATSHGGRPGAAISQCRRGRRIGDPDQLPPGALDSAARELAGADRGVRMEQPLRR